MNQQLQGIKTLEFKLHLSSTQESKIEQWLSVQRWVWNEGLALLKDFEAQRHYNKQDKAYAPCCPIPWEYHWGKDEKGKWQLERPYSVIAEGKRRYPPKCRTLRPVRLDRDSEYSLVPLFAYKLHSDKPWLKECPYKLTQGTIKLLATSWAEYRKGKRKSPRFKTAKGRYANKTLNDTQSGNARVDGDRIRLPKLGWLRVRSLGKRWPEGTLVKSYRIKKEPSGYYLFLVGQLEVEKPKPSDKVCGLDAGVVHLLNDDAGKHIDIPYPLQRRLKALKRLSRKASRQQRGSANQQKTYARMAKLHEKVRRDRRAWHHKITTFAVRKFDGIAVEALNLAGMGKRPKPKLKEDGSGYEHNMATAKAGLNRKLRDAGIGAMYTLLEEKCKTFGRAFQKVPAAYTSQTCNRCGTVDKASRKSQSEFECGHCGHTNNADTNAAMNIRDAAFPEYRRSYPAWAGDVKPVELASVQAMKQEAGQPAPGGDAPPISNSSSSSKGAVPKVQKPCQSVARK